MPQTVKVATLTAMAIIGMFTCNAAHAAMPKTDVEQLQGRVLKQAPRPFNRASLNRVSMVEINVYNLFLPQLINQGKVGLASNRLSIVRLPSNFQPNPNQAELLSQNNIKEEIVSATEGDLVNQSGIPAKTDLGIVQDGSGTVRLQKTDLNIVLNPAKKAPLAYTLFIHGDAIDK